MKPASNGAEYQDITASRPLSTDDLIRQMTGAVRFSVTVDIDLPYVGLFVGDRLYCDVREPRINDLIVFPSSNATICAAQLRRINPKTLTVSCPWGRRRIPHPPLIAVIERIVAAPRDTEFQESASQYVN